MGGLRKYMPITYWTMLIGAIASAGHPGLRRLLLQGRDHRGGAPLDHAGRDLRLAAACWRACSSPRSTPSAWCSWRSTARPRFDPHHPPHESPPVVTVPLILLAIPSICAGYLIGDVGVRRLLRRRACRAPRPELLRHLAVHRRTALSRCRSGWRVAGIVTAWLSVPREDRICRSASRSGFGPVYALVERKYGFDELYSLAPRRRRARARQGLLARRRPGGDRRPDGERLGAPGRLVLRRGAPAAVRAASTTTPSDDPDRRRDPAPDLGDVAVRDDERAAAFRWRSGFRSSPASRCSSPAATATPRAARAGSRSSARCSASWSRIPLYTGFDRAERRLPVRQEKLPWIERFNIHYHLGVDGISLLFVLLNSFITILVVIAGWAVIESRVGQYYGAFLIMSGLLNGVFAALDALLFYVFFEAHADPDVHHHRRLGRAEPGLRGGQVLPLHAARLAADAGGDALPLQQVRRQLRDPRLAQAAAAARRADPALLRLPVRLRGEGADVAGAHLAARRAHRGADRRLGGAGGDPAEARRLRLRALLAADPARRVATSWPG